MLTHTHKTIKSVHSLQKCTWVGVDLDQTVAHNTGGPDYTLLDPIEGAKEALEEITKRGYKVIIFTARPYEHYSYIEGWLDHYQIPHRRIICGKPLLAFMIDDKNIEFDGDWDKALSKIPHES